MTKLNQARMDGEEIVASCKMIAAYLMEHPDVEIELAREYEEPLNPSKVHFNWRYVTLNRPETLEWLNANPRKRLLVTPKGSAIWIETQNNLSHRRLREIPYTL